MNNKKLSNQLFFLIGLLLFTTCGSSNPDWEKEVTNPDFLTRSQKALTDVIVHDIFSLPVASRIYAYPNIAAYEILQNDYPNYKSLKGQLTNFEKIPQPKAREKYCFPLASAPAFLTIGKALIFSELKIETFEKEIYAEFKKINMPSAVYKCSMAFGKEMSDYILAWADKDNYKQTPPFPEYTSDHSVISRAAAIALTHVYGDKFEFIDTVEEEYGLPSR